MSSDDKKQHSFHCTNRTWKAWMQYLSHKWPLIGKGVISMEIEIAIIEHMTGEKIPTSKAHTHKNSQQNNDAPIPIPVPNSPEVVAPEVVAPAAATPTAIIVKTNGGEEYYKQYTDNPLLKQWLLTHGINLNDMNSIRNHLTADDIKVEELTELEYKKWEKWKHTSLIVKKRKFVNKSWKGKADIRDKKLERELLEIMQYLNETDSIVEENKVVRNQLYKAWSLVTEKIDNRTFTNKLHQYIDGGYFAPMDKKYEIFRVEERLERLQELPEYK